MGLIYPALHYFKKLHCIAEIRAYWVETKPFEVDNSRHHYQIALQRCLCLCSRGGRFSKDFSEVHGLRSRGFKFQDEWMATILCAEL